MKTINKFIKVFIIALFCATGVMYTLNAAPDLINASTRFPTVTSDGRRIVYYVEQRVAIKSIFGVDFSTVTPYVWRGFALNSYDAAIYEEEARLLTASKLTESFFSIYTYQFKLAAYIVPYGGSIPQPINPPVKGLSTTPVPNSQPVE